MGGAIKRAMLPWLRLFRVVNLPTVPGDALVGVAATLCWGGCGVASEYALERIALAAVSSVFLYLFGLADNDIVGAATDKGRPIPDGEVSMRAAKVARGLCLVLGVAALASAAFFVSPKEGRAYSLMFAICQVLVALALVAAIVAYNRTKRPLLMGLCRGINVVLGATAICPLLMWVRAIVRAPLQVCTVAAAAAMWTIYIAAVTKYSEGEESDPARRRRVGMLVGGIVYLQLAALIVLTLVSPRPEALRPLLVPGAVLLVLLRAFRFAWPRVSAS